MKKYIGAIETLTRDIDLNNFDESVRRYAAAKVISQDLALQMEGNEEMRYYLQKLNLSMTLLREAIFGESEGYKFAQDRLNSSRTNLAKVKGGLHE